MNAWYPRISRVNAVLSGNAGIWHTACGESVQLAAQGTSPVWAGLAPVWNLNDGRTQFNFGSTLTRAYNAYAGSDDGHWAGATNSDSGRVDIYLNASLQHQIGEATIPRFGGPWFGYLTPYQPGPTHQRKLVLNGGVKATGPILNWAISPGGEVIVYQTATGTYTRAIWSLDGKDISVRNNEDPAAAFIGPDGQPWIVTVTPDFGTLVRPAFSSMGYRIEGDLFYPDARMWNGRLRVVGSSARGELRDVWVNFDAPRQNLRQ